MRTPSSPRTRRRFNPASSCSLPPRARGAAAGVAQSASHRSSVPAPSPDRLKGGEAFGLSRISRIACRARAWRDGGNRKASLLPAKVAFFEVDVGRQRDHGAPSSPEIAVGSSGNCPPLSTRRMCCVPARVINRQPGLPIEVKVGTRCPEVVAGMPVCRPSVTGRSSRMPRPPRYLIDGSWRAATRPAECANRIRTLADDCWSLWAPPYWSLGARLVVIPWNLWAHTNSKNQIAF